jgi:hypothetical protein
VPEADATSPALVVVEVHRLAGAGMEFVDALARLQLAARRGGGHVWLRNASRELRELVEFAGLGEVLPVCERLRLERER